MPTPALFSFTPSLTDGETLEAIFVQRQALAADLVNRVRDSALTPTKFHTLVIGARGMGKTHLVSLVHHRVQAIPELKERLLIAWLREEEWGVTLFVDLLMRILRALAAAEPTIEAQTEALYEQAAEYNFTTEDIEAAGIKLLNELIGDRTLWLIVENLDDLFGGLGEPGQQHLRAFLQTYTNCTILATAPRLFNGVQRRNAPFYGWFRPVHLTEFTALEAQQLLVKIARLRQQTDLVDFLQTPTGQTRVQAIQHLAGGNPRIYVIFADFLTYQSLDELAPPFMSLVDALTPYYQSRMQFLSPQQRKIVELLCEKKIPLPVKIIAQRCFMTPQTASSQLKDLRQKGYVKAESIGRESYYELSEPLMRICLGVKKERGEPLRLLVDFLRVWYPQTELQIMHQALLTAPERSDSMCRYLERALADSDITDEDPRIQAYLDEIQAHLEREDYSNALKIAEKLLQVRDSWFERERYAFCLVCLGHNEDAFINAEKAIDGNPNYHEAWTTRGWILGELGRYEEAISSYDHALKIKPDEYESWNNRGLALRTLGRYEEAISSYDHALKIKPGEYEIWYNRGICLNNLGRYEEATSSFNHALKIRPDDHESWTNRGINLDHLGRYEEAISSYDHALKIKLDYWQAWTSRGVALNNLGRYEEAIPNFDHALKIKPDCWQAWRDKGQILTQLNQSEEAILSFDKAIELNPDASSLQELQDLRLEALATSNTWSANAEILETLLSEAKPIYSGFLEKAIHSLFTTLPDSQQWQPTIAELVNRMEAHAQLPELGIALVIAAGELNSDLVSLAKATAWRDAWVAVVGSKPEFALPLRLLNTALAYKQNPEDPRVLLALPTEERTILQQVLGLTD